LEKDNNLRSGASIDTHPDRRGFIGSTLLALTTLGLTVACGRTVHDKDTDGVGIVRTAAGDVRGRRSNGVYKFLGLRYGEDFRQRSRFAPGQGYEMLLSMGTPLAARRFRR
jgi:hypothetical protein